MPVQRLPLAPYVPGKITQNAGGYARTAGAEQITEPQIIYTDVLFARFVTSEGLRGLNVPQGRRDLPKPPVILVVIDIQLVPS